MLFAGGNRPLQSGRYSLADSLHRVCQAGSLLGAVSSRLSTQLRVLLMVDLDEPLTVNAVTTISLMVHLRIPPGNDRT